MFTVLKDPDLDVVTVPDRGDARSGFAVRTAITVPDASWKALPVPADGTRVDVHTRARANSHRPGCPPPDSFAGRPVFWSGSIWNRSGGDPRF